MAELFQSAKAFRKPPKRVDYLLRYTRDFIIAVVEAKAEYNAAADALQQAVAPSSNCKASIPLPRISFAFVWTIHEPTQDS